MLTPQEIETKFWKALKSDMTMMIGLDGVEDGHARPMTGRLDGERGPIWFFTVKDHALVRNLRDGNRTIATFTSKGHDIFATVHGTLSLDTNREMTDKSWNRFIAAWFEGGKDDPKLALLRLDAERAEIWVDASSLVAGIKRITRTKLLKLSCASLEGSRIISGHFCISRRRRDMHDACMVHYVDLKLY